ncbi:putative membrane protein [Lactiplantibacillus plantarum]|nr:putative membrane protein [Lactiplantibacillus plantarum]KZU81340.1 putative membrane protein [Lactiplantibacillus plantarum]
MTPPHQLLYFDLILPYQVLEKRFGRQFEKLITVITCELWYPKTL